MKPAIKVRLLTTLLGVVIAAELAAQTTAFTYQGELQDNGQAASGVYDLQFVIYDDASGGNPIGGALTSAATTVSNGLFTVTLDFGTGVFTGAGRWLEIGARDGGSSGPFEVLGARQPLRPAPYAFHAYSVNASNVIGVLPDTAIPNSVVRASGPQIIHGPVRFEDVVEFAGGEGGPPFSLTYHDVIPGLNAAMLGFRTAEGFWQTGGNAGTVPGTHFLGTTDDRPLELKVNGLRALRLEPTATNDAVNVIAGSPGNGVAPGAVGVTVGGGGFGATAANTAHASFATIGGGSGNTIQSGALSATIAGGSGNLVETNAISASLGGGSGNLVGSFTFGATVAGGQGNEVSSNTLYCIIGGGYHNIVLPGAVFATIGGGEANYVRHNSWHATVGGGLGNSIEQSQSAGIGGGFDNFIGIDAHESTIGGGAHNNIAHDGRRNVIGGGNHNLIRAGAYSAAVGGGANNLIEAPFSTIAGGERNEINLSDPFFANHAVIGGGNANNIWGADEATIAGGSNNGILEGASGASISGGFGNTVLTNARFATIPGGYACRVGNNADYAFATGLAAHALHPGAFVWADASQAEMSPFSSSDSNQFLVRASGGVGINTSYPAAALDVRVLDSEAASIHVGGELANGLGKLVYFGDIPYVSIGEQGTDDQMVLTAGSFYFDNRSSDGRVGIGRAAAANKLEVEGDASKTTAGLWLANSDRRIKRDIRPLTSALETLSRVRPVSFRYTEAYQAAHPGIADRDYVNVVAQEFEEVFPEYVKTSGEAPPERSGEEIRQVDTYPLLIYGTAAIQELNQKVEVRTRNAEACLKELQAENAALKARLERLEALFKQVPLAREGAAR